MLDRYCCQENKGSRILGHHTVEEIRLIREKNANENYFELQVTCTPSHSDERTIDRWTYLAKEVILALPKEALKQIRFSGFPNEEIREFAKSLDAVTAHPAFKLFLLYDSPWWKDQLGLQARASTDLPIRQVYYLGEDERPDGPSLIMASYSDEHYVDFWDPLVNDSKREAEQRNPATQQRIDFSAYAASRRIIDKATLQLQTMHELNQPPKCKLGVVKEWKEAWHFWNVHTKPWEAARKMIRPFTKTNLFVCGEAYSLEQGWVEGALKSAERVLKEMEVKPPNWVSKAHCKKSGYGDFNEYISH